MGGAENAGGKIGSRLASGVSSQGVVDERIEIGGL
jgi:hypothetical protein